MARVWFEYLKSLGSPLIENLGNLIIDAHRLREVVFTHQVSMLTEFKKLKDEFALIQEVVNMKVDVATSFGILRTSKEPLLHWKQSIEFKQESLVKAKQELKRVYNSVKEVIEKFYMYLKDSHIKSFITTNNQLVDIERMKMKFLEFR